MRVRSAPLAYRRPRRLTAVGVACAVGCVLAVLVGLAIRSWLLGHQMVNSDEAVAGLMAEQIRHGHFYTFFWGQQYGGAEPYVIAFLFSIFGSSGVVVKVAPVLLSVVSALLTWRIARRLVQDHRLAVLAGALVFVWPWVAVWNSTIEYGFRGVTSAAGLASILFALRILDRSDGFVDFAALGVVSGIAWWASPECVYFLLPALVLLIGSSRSFATRGRMKGWTARMGVGLAGLALGMLPWLATNARTGFASLSISNSPVFGNSTYLDRLEIFHQNILPMLLGVRLPVSTLWLHGVTLGHAAVTVAEVLLAAAVVVGVLQGGRVAVLALAVLAYPFLYALFPATGYWEDGRYGVYFVPLAVLLVVGVIQGLVSRYGSRRTRRAAHKGLVLGGTAVLVIATVLTVLAFKDFYKAAGPAPSKFAADWGHSYQVAHRALSGLEASGVRYAWADYWTAYNMDLVGGRAVVLSPPNLVRWKALYRQVASSSRPAWIFESPAQHVAAQENLQSPNQGPNGMTEGQFLAKLDAMGVHYRVVHAGVLDAVLPARKVAPVEVGLPYSNA